MDWISGTGRDEGGRLCAEVQSLTGDRRLASLDELTPDLKAPKVVRRSADFSLHELRCGDTQNYLDGLGCPGLEPAGQPVYEADTSIGTLVIPAQLLVLATVGVNSQFRKMLLRPWGPRFLMTALALDFSLAVCPAPNRMFKAQVEHPSIVMRMRWVLTHPSADACWSSVYRNALDGRFDMALPKASVRAALMGRVVERKFLVTRLKFMSLRPTEVAHPFAEQFADPTVVPRLVLNRGLDRSPAHRKAAAPTRDAALVAMGEVKELTDEQWARVEPILLAFLKPKPSKQGAARNHTIREMVEAIRLKLGTPYSWSELPVEFKLMQGASVLLSKLKRGGVWDAVVAAACPPPVGA